MSPLQGKILKGKEIQIKQLMRHTGWGGSELEASGL
jgi:hypothetical protein